MALTATDVLAPNGLIEPDLFPAEQEEDGSPGDALIARIEAYIADGVARSTGAAVPEEAARQWTYYRAFTAAYVRLSALPASITQSDQGGHGYTAEQLRNLRQLAKDAKDAFDAQVPLIVQIQTASTRSVVNTFDW